MKSKNLICLAALILFVPTVLASNTLYVNGVSGNDGDTCTSPTTACKTIGHAISLVVSGETIVVAPATYAEHLGIGTSVTIVGSSATTTIIDGKVGFGRVVTISSTSAHVILSNLTIRNGHMSGYCGTPGGGGVYNKGTLTITNSTISGNTASAFTFYKAENSGCGIEGGGILNYGALTIDNSTISGNSVAVSGCFVVGTYCAAVGGGIWSNAGSVTINNSTISGNTAVRHGCAVPLNCRLLVGGIFATSSVMMISSSTISGNGPDGIVGTATLQNSIVASNTGANCSGTVMSHGYNLSSDGTCDFNAHGDLNNHDPLLGPLQNNGGPTQTMALLPGSLAIDAGNPSGCTDGQGHLLTT